MTHHLSVHPLNNTLFLSAANFWRWTTATHWLRITLLTGYFTIWVRQLWYSITICYWDDYWYILKLRLRCNGWLVTIDSSFFSLQHLTCLSTWSSNLCYLVRSELAKFNYDTLLTILVRFWWLLVTTSAMIFNWGEIWGGVLDEVSICVQIFPLAYTRSLLGNGIFCVLNVVSAGNL